MSRKARITIVQFNKDADDPAENLQRMKAHVEDHAESDLIVFPELALHGHEIAHDHQQQIRSALRAVSMEDIADFDACIANVKARVIYGKLVEREGKLYNLATYTDGEKRVSYAKTHVHWSEPFAAGDTFPVVQDFQVPLGMLICFDAAFPEVPRMLAIRGAKLIVNISAIPEHFHLKHVHRRLVACSIENQVFTVFANRTGPGFLGGSAVVDPRGEIIALADDKQQVLTVEVNLREVDEWREEEPLFPHRRPELYEAIAHR